MPLASAPSPSSAAPAASAGPVSDPTATGDPFAPRHHGQTEADLRAMLDAVDAATLDELIARTVPADIRTDGPLSLKGLESARGEAAALDLLRTYAAQNRPDIKSLIGQGYHGTRVPSVILRNVLENPAWYTPYTPYQAEMAQGRLEAILNFQTAVSDLTGLPLTGASLLDEATAAAEAMGMCLAVTRSKTPSLFRGRRRAPPDPGGGAHPGPHHGRRGHRGPDRRLRRRGRRPLRRAGADPFDPRSGLRPGRAESARRRRARRRRPRGGGHRPARLLSDHAAGRLGRRHRGGLGPALRRAHGLRRSARRVPFDPREARPAHARPPDRALARRAGHAGPAHGAANARAAHPPRQGDQQHLHRPGAARRRRRLLRRLPRAGRPAHDRPRDP